MTWKFHEDSNDRVPNRDFTELNKMSLKGGNFKAHVSYCFIILGCV